MTDHHSKKRRIRADRSVTATSIVISAMMVLLIITSLIINNELRSRSLTRMEEGVNTVIKDVTIKLRRDSRILNAMAETLSQVNDFDVNEIKAVMESNVSLLETIQVSVLMPDNRIILANGSILDAKDNQDVNFEEEAPLGEHVSGRKLSLVNDDYVLRHFIPIMQDGQIAALLYGRTYLDSFQQNLNIENIYNSSAEVYIIDTKTGDFLLDTKHDELKNVDDYRNRSKWITRGKRAWDEYIDDLLHLGSDYVVYRCEDEDGWSYIHYAPAGINDWSIAVSVPEREAFASVFVVQRIYACLAVIFAVMIAIYYWWIRKNAGEEEQKAVERAVMEERLQKAEAADRAKSLFLSNMSHDIRTPMNAIIGFATLAQSSVDNPERTSEYLKKILSSGNHLLSLINDILDMSRIESGKLNIEEKECSISEIFTDMRNIILSQMQAKRLQFFMDTIDVEDEDIYCDKLHVNQVLLNLLSNAIKFTPEGGTVSLTVRQRPKAREGYGSYEICVRDTGVGMSPKFLEHIFEPFERERNTTASGIQGTGLGMAITKNIVDAMGGSIRIQSELGTGSEFIVDLDFRLCKDRGQTGVVPELEGFRALVVDDSFITCDSVTKMLAKIGMRTEWTLHGKDALLYARQAQEAGDAYQAYIIDWYLPDLSGFEVVRQIRSIAGNDVPIIIVTAYDGTTIEDEAMEAGATAFCQKPIFLSGLKEILLETMGGTPPAKPEEDRPALAESLKGMRLLLAEDNELNREIAQELLGGSGFLVETAENGKEAVEMVKASSPGYYSLVLMDIQMPQMNGYEAAEAIRALDDPALAGIPIVAMTANAFDEDKKRALESGMNAHVAKPIDMENLLQVLTDILLQA